jgi:hypothetical protein
MAQTTFEIGAAARIVIDGCHGDLTIKGSERTTVEVSGDRSLGGRASQSGDELTIRGYNGDLQVQVGREASIAGRRISGDVSIADVASVELQGLAGDLSLAGVSNCRVDEVGGDFDVQVHDGAVDIGRVGGDLRVENAQSLRLGAVGGDAELTGIKQLMELGRIGGDLRLEWAGQLAEAISGAVGGDAELNLAPEASFVLRATVGGDIVGDGPPPAANAEGHEAEDSGAPPAGGSHGWDLASGGGELTATFGNGGQDLRLTVGGDLQLHGGHMSNSTFEGGHGEEMPIGDFGIGNEMRRLARDLKAMGRDLARDLAREVRASTRGTPGPRPRVHVQWNDKAFHFDAEQIDRLTREAREAAASGIALAQEAVERALVNMASANHGRPPSPPRPPEPPRAPGVPAREYTGQTVRIERAVPERSPEEVTAEKLAILRMVSEGRLGVDEAEVMLRALEGRG